MRFRLLEDDDYKLSDDVYLYRDINNGKYYYFDGQNLVAASKKLMDKLSVEYNNSTNNNTTGKNQNVKFEDILDELHSEKFSKELDNDVEEIKKREYEEKIKWMLERDNKAYNEHLAQQINNKIRNFLTKNYFNIFTMQTKWGEVRHDFSGDMLRKKHRLKKESIQVIPTVYIYTDASGSMCSEAIQDLVNKATATLAEYDINTKPELKDKFNANPGSVRALDVKRLFFADEVSTDKSKVGSGNSGAALVESINRNKPDNLLILTDGQFEVPGQITVPGMFWFIYVGDNMDSKSNYAKDPFKGHVKSKEYNTSGFRPINY